MSDPNANQPRKDEPIMNTSNDVYLDSLIVDQRSDALIFSDIKGSIQRWNAAATSIFGYSASEALGQSLDLIIPEKLRLAHWRGFNEAIERKTLRLRTYSSRPVARQVIMPQARCNIAIKVSGSFSQRMSIRRKRFIQL